MKLLIGRKYEQEFNSAFLLIHGCAALEDYAASGELADGTAEITYGMNTYRYDASIENAQFAGAENSAEEAEQGFTVWGATWFSKLRGEQGAESADALWLDFMKNLADGYHNRYAILTYEPQKGEEIKVAEVEGIAKRVLNALHPAFYNEPNENNRPTITVQAASEENQLEETQDIYGISLRLSLNCGGQSEYVIGKIYFEKHFSEMRPMPRQNGLLMKKTIDGLEKKTEEKKGGSANGGVGTGDNKKESKLSSKDELARDNALKALGDCISKSIGGQDNFLNYLIIGEGKEESGDRDVETVNRLLERTADGTHELQCDGVKVLCISHLQWKSWAFDVSIGGTKALRFTFDLDKVLSIKCLNCFRFTEDGQHKQYDVLVMKNEVLLQGKEENGEPSVVRIPTIATEGLGLTKEETDRIRKESVLAQHIIPRSCVLSATDSLGGMTCNCIRCASQLFSVYYDQNGKVINDAAKAKRTEVLCKDCQYPEKVYYNPLTDTRDETVSLVLDVNTMTLIRKDKAKECPWCRRHYNSNAHYCNTCLLAEKVVQAKPTSEDSPVMEDIRQARALYKQYAYILPLLLRVVTCFNFKKKYCVEDDGVIIFIIGKRRYRFDKINAKRTGMIKSATRMFKRERPNRSV